jgi:hypothetical protein
VDLRVDGSNALAQHMQGKKTVNPEVVDLLAKFREGRATRVREPNDNLTLS